MSQQAICSTPMPMSPASLGVGIGAAEDLCARSSRTGLDLGSDSGRSFAGKLAKSKGGMTYQATASGDINVKDACGKELVQTGFQSARINLGGGYSLDIQGDPHVWLNGPNGQRTKVADFTQTSSFVFRVGGTNYQLTADTKGDGQRTYLKSFQLSQIAGQDGHAVQALDISVRGWGNSHAKVTGEQRGEEAAQAEAMKSDGGVAFLDWDLVSGGKQGQIYAMTNDGQGGSRIDAATNKWYSQQNDGQIETLGSNGRRITDAGVIGNRSHPYWSDILATQAASSHTQMRMVMTVLRLMGQMLEQLQQGTGGSGGDTQPVSTGAAGGCGGASEGSQQPAGGQAQHAARGQEMQTLLQVVMMLLSVLTRMMADRRGEGSDEQAGCGCSNGAGSSQYDNSLHALDNYMSEIKGLMQRI